MFLRTKHLANLTACLTRFPQTQAGASFVVGQRAMSSKSGQKRTGRLGNTGGLPPPTDVGYEKSWNVDGMKVANRNPRTQQLEGGSAVRKGFTTDNRMKHFIHRLRLNFSGQYAKAYVDVPDGSMVLSATTKEWYLESKLYSQCDQTASRVLGEAMAQRLLESGITSVYWDIGTKKYHGRVKKFIDAVVDGGVSLKETKAYKPARN